MLAGMAGVSGSDGGGGGGSSCRGFVPIVIL